MNDDDNEEKELIELKIINNNTTINTNTDNNTNNRSNILIITEIKEIITEIKEIISSSSINAMKKEVVLKKIASNSLR